MFFNRVSREIFFILMYTDRLLRGITQILSESLFYSIAMDMSFRFCSYRTNKTCI